MGPPSKSGVLLLLVIGGVGSDLGMLLLAVIPLHARTIAGLRPFSLIDWSSWSSSRCLLRRRQKHNSIPINTRPAIAPESPPMMACFCDSFPPAGLGVAAPIDDSKLLWLSSEVEVGLPVTTSGREVCCTLSPLGDDSWPPRDPSDCELEFVVDVVGRLRSVVMWTVTNEVLITVVPTTSVETGIGTSVVTMAIEPAGEVGVAALAVDSFPCERIPPNSDVTAEKISPNDIESRSMSRSKISWRFFIVATDVVHQIYASLQRVSVLVRA